MTENKVNEQAFKFITSKIFAKSFFPSSSNTFYRNSSRIEEETNKLKTKNFTSKAQICFSSAKKVLDAKIENQLFDKVIKSTQDFGLIVKGAVENKNSSNDRKKTKQLFESFKKSLFFITKDVKDYSQICATSSREDVKYFHKKFCSHYQVYFKNLNDLNAKKLCSK